MSGKVFLVGAGPGDPELLTLKALRLLRSADVVLHDDLIVPEVLALVPKTTEVRNVGKRAGQPSARQEQINELLIRYALLGYQVVRLKGGDPFLFGRGGEEVEALRQANIEFEIVPGITAALGAAAAAKFPLTHREMSSSLLVLTGHGAKSENAGHWPAQIPASTTVVIYMPGYDYETTSHSLLRAGVEPGTPLAIISKATTEEQEIYLTTAGGLPSCPKLPAPTLMVVGEVVKMAESRKSGGFNAEALFRNLAPIHPEFLMRQAVDAEDQEQNECEKIWNS